MLSIIPLDSIKIVPNWIILKHYDYLDSQLEMLFYKICDLKQYILQVNGSLMFLHEQQQKLYFTNLLN